VENVTKLTPQQKRQALLDPRVEAVAEAFMRYAGGAFSDLGSVTVAPTCTADWPKDFSPAEQSGFRAAARAAIQALDKISG